MLAYNNKAIEYRKAKTKLMRKHIGMLKYIRALHTKYGGTAPPILMSMT